MSRPAASPTSYGQVIEYIEDRLYLASYTQPPNEQTPFPYASKKQQQPNGLRSPRKALVSKPKTPAYFSLDRSFRYNAFHADFGPLHIGHLYRFAILLHEILAIPGNEDRPVVFWCKADSRSRANAACVLACYMVLIQSWPPHLALAPLSQMDPPCMPFRDAGYSQADYTLTIQDVVYGVWRAKEEGLCSLMDFSLEEYETFERVDMGDFNWITPSFVAFASPQSDPIDPVPPSHPRYASIPSTVAEVERCPDLSSAFRNVLVHFATRNIGLVVRLNSELYCPTYFTKLGIQHLDMIFPDGTCPSLAMVRKFINLAHEVITVRKRCIAVHCKAGLGRTGCLIGAYLIYRYGFSASELIGFMRFQRPGMMVGPQQHWLHLNQGIFRQWWFEDTIVKERVAAALAAIPASSPYGLAPPATPTHSSRRSAVSSHTPTSQRQAPPAEPRSNGHSEPHSPTGMTNGAASAAVPSCNPPDCGVLNENLPAPTPGQPRKHSRMYPGDVSPVRAGVRSPLRHASKPSSGDPFVDAAPSHPDSISSDSDLAERDGVDFPESYTEERDTADADLLQLRLNRARQTKRPASRSPLRQAKPSGTTVAVASVSVSHSPEDGKTRRAVTYSSGSATATITTTTTTMSSYDEKTVSSWPADVVEIGAGGGGYMHDHDHDHDGVLDGCDIDCPPVPPVPTAHQAGGVTAKVAAAGRKVSGTGMTVPKTRAVRGSSTVSGAGPNGVRKSSGRVRSMGSSAAWAAGRK